MWRFAGGGRCQLVEKRKTFIECLGVVIVAITMLIFEVSPKIPKAFLVSSTDHEGGQIFFTYGRNSKGTFSIHRFLGVNDGTRIGQLLNLACKESWHHPHCSNATIGFNCLYMSKEFAMVGVVIDPIFLVVHEQAFVGSTVAMTPCVFAL